MYAKIFEQIYDSSIAEDWQTRVVFQDMLVLADRDGVVDRTVESISRRTNIPIDIVSRAVTKLEQPDQDSRSPECDGRRIVRLDEHRDWGWKIVNHAYYRQLKSDLEKRDKAAQRQRKCRENKRLDAVTNKRDSNVTDSDDVLPDVTACDRASPSDHMLMLNVLREEEDKPEKKKSNRTSPSKRTRRSSTRQHVALHPPTVDEIRAFCTERNNGIDPEYFEAFYARIGWVDSKGKPIVDWKAAVRTWEQNNKRKPESKVVDENWIAEHGYNPHGNPEDLQ